jgi:hypothetical protein
MRMPPRARSPQEKKRLSLMRDSIVCGERPHALRKHWGKKKRSAERARRTAERVSLATRPDEFAPARRRTVRKWGSAKLGEAIAVNQERRAGLQEAPRKSAAARLRRSLRRGRVRRPPA